VIWFNRPMPDDKQAWRERTWEHLERTGAARFPGAKGRIPNFDGAGQAADRLAGLDEWKDAEALKANPDMPQLPVRARALADGKLVYMAVPKLAAEQPFLLLDPARLEGSPRASASIKGAGRAGQPVDLDGMAHIDLIVCGTVAVNRKGVRLGKGGGYSDLEFALASEVGIVDDDTVIATTVHAGQVVDADLPETDHDFRVDLVVTPDEVIRCRRRRRPAGVIWSHLDDAKIDAVPALARRRPPGSR
jgi:5-formyltetrahydrofolate cyclo-ligase